MDQQIFPLVQMTDGLFIMQVSKLSENHGDAYR